MKECGRAAIISLQITSWTFSLICLNIINNPILPGASEFCSRRAGLGGKRRNCWLIMWPIFSHASGGVFRSSLINILTFELSNNNENPELEIIWHKHGHIDAIKKKKGGGNPMWEEKMKGPLRYSVTSVSQLVPCIHTPLWHLKRYIAQAMSVKRGRTAWAGWVKAKYARVSILGARMIYLKHATPVTPTTLTMCCRLAEQTPSLLCMCTLVCFTLLIVRDAAKRARHSCWYSLYIKGPVLCRVLCAGLF